MPACWTRSIVTKHLKRRRPNHGSTSGPPSTLRGKVAYPGVVTGAVNIIDQNYGFADVFDECSIDVNAEIKRLDDALRKTRIQTLYLEKRVADRLTPEDAAISTPT